MSKRTSDKIYCVYHLQSAALVSSPESAYALWCDGYTAAEISAALHLDLAAVHNTLIDAMVAERDLEVGT